MKLVNLLFTAAVAGRFGQRRHFRQFHHHKRVQKSNVPANRAMKWINGRIYEQDVAEFGTGQNYDQAASQPDTKMGTIKDLNPMNLYAKNLAYP